MPAAREMARRITRQHERARAERKKAVKELGLIGLTFLVLGAVIATLGYANDNVYVSILGGMSMLMGAVFGILWGVSDDR